MPQVRCSKYRQCRRLRWTTVTTVYCANQAIINQLDSEKVQVCSFHFVVKNLISLSEPPLDSRCVVNPHSAGTVNIT